MEAPETELVGRHELMAVHMIFQLITDASLEELQATTEDRDRSISRRCCFVSGFEYWRYDARLFQSAGSACSATTLLKRLLGRLGC